MTELQLSWPWITLIAFGMFHGLNPAMGWLFAVARGFQERRLRAVIAAFGPITLGHALAIGVVVLPMGLLGMAIPRSSLLIVTGLTLIGFAGYRRVTRFRHPRWIGARVRPIELAAWSFLMATSHGAGLMVAPLLAGTAAGGVAQAAATHGDHTEHSHLPMATASAGHANHLPALGENALGPALAAIVFHSAAMLVAGAAIAFVVYRVVGVEALRRYWINLDLIWVGALLVTGTITLGLGVWALAFG